MKRIFEPYTIKHFYIHKPDEAILLGKKYFLVIWFKSIAIGHYWIEDSSEYQNPPKFRELVHSIIKEYHSKKGFFQSNWEESLLQGDYRNTCDFFEQLLLQTSSERIANNSISVVVCTRNRANALRNCIQALLASSDSDFELIVVDNNPSDNSTELLVQEFKNVKYYLEPRKGLDIARNTGAFYATKNIVAYTDDDVVIHKDWIKELKNSFSNPLTMAVTGLVLPLSLETRTQYIFEKYWGFNRGYQPIEFDHGYFLANLPYGVPVWDIGAGANMAFRKEVFDLIGWFDERLDVGAAGCSGDSEYWYRILAEGWNCLYNPTAIVFHQHRDKEADLSNQLFHYMRGQVASLLIQNEKYQHQGNLKRLFRGLPEYYYHRIKDQLLKGPSEDFNTIFTEIKGCVSGWRFYQTVKNNRQIDPLRLPGSFDTEIVPTAKVSVIITCFNYGQFLSEAIESVIKQSYQNVEIIVVDDGSTDNTETIIKQYPQVISICTKRVGLSAARNIGVQLSKGGFIIFLDADDYLYSNAIELNLYYFRLYPNAAFISGAHDRIDLSKNLLPIQEAIQKDSDQYRSLLLGNYIAMEATVLYRRELFFCFHFDTKLAACEDYDINLNISRHFPSFTHTTKITAYRIHNKNMSGSKTRMLTAIDAVFEKQKPLLLNQAEKIAFETGLNNWRNYYSR
jgi:glycosyltransferase involved in cell wall biosynthesis